MSNPVVYRATLRNRELQKRWRAWKTACTLGRIARCLMKIIPIAITLILPIGVCFAQAPAQPQSGAGESQSAKGQSKEASSSRASGGDLASLATRNSQKYKGTLVDAVCARNGASTTSGSQSAADRTAPPDGAAGTRANQAGDKGQKREANRQSTGAESCGATANTTDFGLRLQDGRMFHFDSVGSERVKEGFKTKKKWADAAASKKPIRSTVHGVESGDTLMALSVD